MLFRSRGWLCTGTICKALVETAGGQKGVTAPSPEPPVSEADSWKIEEPVVKPNTISTNSEQEAGWSGEIVEPVLENGLQEQLANMNRIYRTRGRRDK
jgi:hypothetical protein